MCTWDPFTQPTIAKLRLADVLSDAFSLFFQKNLSSQRDGSSYNASKCSQSTMKMSLQEVPRLMWKLMAHFLLR